MPFADGTVVIGASHLGDANKPLDITAALPELKVHNRVGQVGQVGITKEPGDRVR